MMDYEKIIKRMANYIKALESGLLDLDAIKMIDNRIKELNR